MNVHTGDPITSYEAAAAIEPHRFWDRVIPDESGCWNWSGYRNEKGYGRLKIDRRRILAHRYVDELLRGPMPAGLEIMHSCDNRACVRPEHLVRATHKQNMEDMAQKFRGSRGATHCRAKLTPGEVRMIREFRAEGMKASDLGMKFGISVRHVYEICLGRSWREKPRETQKALL